MQRFGDNSLKFITLDEGICHKCRYLHSDGMSCMAYPDGIPEDILIGKIDHTEPQPDDNGIQFKPRQGERIITTFPELEIGG